MDGTLIVEIQRACGLSNSEYRLFDITSRILGCRRVRPYVNCKLQWGTATTGPQGTSFVEAPEDGSWFDWGGKLEFPVRADFWRASRFSISMEVLDKRELQGTLRGDSLIGTGEIFLDPNTVASTPQQGIELFRNGKSAGELILAIRMEAPDQAKAIMATSTSCPLTRVVHALAQVLRAPNAVELLMAARPTVLQLSEDAESEVHRLLKAWVQRFCQQTLQLSGVETDDHVISALWRLARSAQEIVACCAPSSTDDVPDIVVAWLKKFFSSCAGEQAQLNEERLRNLLTMREQTSAGHANPEDELLQMGVQVHNLNLENSMLQAVLARFKEAEQGSEDEIFTCEQIVQDGRAMPGLSVILRRSPGADTGFHVFVYHTVSIRQWQANCLCDPCTRAALRAEDILPVC